MLRILLHYYQKVVVCNSIFAKNVLLNGLALIVAVNFFGSYSHFCLKSMIGKFFANKICFNWTFQAESQTKIGCPTFTIQK
jgi:hypothetical protein